MLKFNKTIFITLLLTFILIFTAACGNKSESSEAEVSSESKKDNFSYSDKTDSSSDTAASQESSSSSEKQTASVTVTSYTEGSKKDLLNFSEGKDMFGEMSINIIGDSISQGKNAEKLYDDSWASLFKGAVNEKFGTYNMGYVSFNYHDPYGVVTCEEIHTVTDKTGNWIRKSGWESPLTPGNVSYTADSFTEGATLEIKLNRKEGGIDRHINGFYIYHVAGATYGSYEVRVNGKSVKTVNCAQDTGNTCARSPYIAIPDGCTDQITIEIIKLTNGYEPITISGISYIDKPEAVTVNNYSLSGICLTEIDDSVLEQLAKANIVLFTLGTNDAGNAVDTEKFKHKVDVVTEACKKNGSLLIVGDVIWARYGNDFWATAYKDILHNAAKEANGYLIDFTTLPISQILADNDICHPTVAGHRLMAEKLCSFFDLKLK